MKPMIATWPRRAVAVSTWLIATVLMASLMAHVGQPDPAQLEIGDWMKRFFVVPSLAALMVFLFTTAIARSVHAAPVSALENSSSSAEEPAKPFVAQVVGMIWLNPLQRNCCGRRDSPGQTRMTIWFAPIRSPSLRCNR
jgi:hypothetical protein